MRALVAISCTITVLVASHALADTCMPATEAEIEVIREAMELKLVDAQSARFREVCSIPGHDKVKGDRVFCGLVNAKNRMGAYSGYINFSYVDGAKSATLVDPSSADLYPPFAYCLACTPSADCDAMLD